MSSFLKELSKAFEYSVKSQKEEAVAKAESFYNDVKAELMKKAKEGKKSYKFSLPDNVVWGELKSLIEKDGLDASLLQEKKPGAGAEVVVSGWHSQKEVSEFELEMLKVVREMNAELDRLPVSWKLFRF